MTSVSAIGLGKDTFGHYILTGWVCPWEPEAEDDLEGIDDESIDVIEWV